MIDLEDSRTWAQQSVDRFGESWLVDLRIEGTSKQGMLESSWESEAAGVSIDRTGQWVVDPCPT